MWGGTESAKKAHNGGLLLWRARVRFGFGRACTSILLHRPQDMRVWTHFHLGGGTKREHTAQHHTAAPEEKKHAVLGDVFALRCPPPHSENVCSLLSSSLHKKQTQACYSCYERQKYMFRGLVWSQKKLTQNRMTAPSVHFGWVWRLSLSSKAATCRFKGQARQSRRGARLAGRPAWRTPVTSWPRS